MATDKDKRSDAGEQAGDEPADTVHPPRPERSESARSTLVIDGRELAYTMRAETLNLRGDNDKDRASLFTVAYLLDGVDDPSTRPVTFCFNGGPGSSSAWLQYGALGPRRVVVPDTHPAPPPPNAVVDNAQSILDQTDLVFIDPVGTGFSRPLGKAEPGDFHSVQGDIESVGELIRRWLSRHGRWASPKLIIGESYGTTRAAGLAHHLGELGVHLNGLVLISIATDFQTLIFEPGNDLPHVIYLPSYAATAWYHDRLPNRPDTLGPFLDEVIAFSTEEYAPALLLGDRLPLDRRQALAERLHTYTGLPTDELVRRNLRIEYLWFARTLLGSGHRTVGRLDARYVGPDLDPTGQQLTRDPSYDAALGAFTVAVNDQLRRGLGWQTDDHYAVLSRRVNEGWSWESKDRMGYPNTTAALRKALVSNPSLEVLICQGRFDLATPFFAATYTRDHLGTPPEQADKVRLAFYDAGHMMYFHPPSLKKLRADLVEHFARAVPKR